MIPVLTSTPLYHNDTNNGKMMKVILVAFVSIAVTSACIGTGSDCDGIPDCKCDGSEVEAPCCFKMEPCPGAYMWIFYTLCTLYMVPNFYCLF